jgi:site-specific DNA-methyltransferase (adenine-specific)
MKSLAEAGIKFDSIVCDPPYHLTSISKRWSKGGKPTTSTGAYGNMAKGFLGQAWDGGNVAFRQETWELAYELLNPGGYLARLQCDEKLSQAGCRHRGRRV